MSYHKATITPTSRYAYNQTDFRSSSSSSSTPETVMYPRDWRQALRTPPTYRIGNRTVRFNYHFSLLAFSALALFVLFFYIRPGSSSSSDIAWIKQYHETATPLVTINAATQLAQLAAHSYNSKYPLTAPVVVRPGVLSYRIALVADLDQESKHVKADGSIVWRSYLLKGHIYYTATTREIQVAWDAGEPVLLEYALALNGRGMELSELVTFDGKLLTLDDRTGVIYEFVDDKPIPWVIMMDGDGKSSKGFKSEWATVKDQKLYVGSMGKEWTKSTGEYVNDNPMYVKVVTPQGSVQSLNWAENYKKMRKVAQNISFPGYMIHESGVWSEAQKKWFFLPRRCSKETYNETRDEHMGCNILIKADEQFAHIEAVELAAGLSLPTHGFSSFKFVPNTDDTVILALKTEELNGKTATFISAFSISGEVLLPEQRLSTEHKYEGLEFI